MLARYLILPLIFFLGGCDVMFDRMSNVGRPPEFNKLKTYDQSIQHEIAKAQAGSVYEEDANVKKNANSLWRPGARTFFRDQRARAIGDILKVVVTIQDSAKLDNKTERKRNGDSSMGAPNFLGLENKLKYVLPGKFETDKLISLNSKDNSKGEGKVDRKETVNTTVAATVIKILPNNNLVIKGSQEIRVNYELREVTVEGIVRPEDISSENSVTLDQIAEARISYGGRGQISEVQQDRYGRQVLDIISPF
jgi:flagellar L-ring protein precursor FlgH